MGKKQKASHRYSYYCFHCKRTVSSKEIKREVGLKNQKSDQNQNKNRPLSFPVCPYCGKRIRRNYKVWCSYCNRVVKSSELIRHRRLDGTEIRICPHCGWDKSHEAEQYTRI